MFRFMYNDEPTKGFTYLTNVLLIDVLNRYIHLDKSKENFAFLAMHQTLKIALGHFRHVAVIFL